MDRQADAGVDGMREAWTREHDRVIAEKCEGLVFDEKGSTPIPSGGRFPEYIFGGDPGLAFYNRDLVADVRAAEAWRKQEEGRMWTHGVDRHGVEYAHLFGPAHGLSKYSAAGPGALAWALWGAVQ